MPRSPMDKVPQRVLVHDLKRAIDLIPRDRQAVTRVRRLVEENPRSARSTHVVRNLGRARAATLAHVIGEPLLARSARAGAALPVQPEAARSSSSARGDAMKEEPDTPRLDRFRAGTREPRTPLEGR